MKTVWLQKWRWDDFLGAGLVLAIFVSISAIPALLRMDPDYKRMRAREDCRILAQSFKVVMRLEQKRREEGQAFGPCATLLYTCKSGGCAVETIQSWPRLSPRMRPWRYYEGAAKIAPGECQNAREFLQDFEPDNMGDKDLLLKAGFIDFDPWGKPYIINIGNMREKRAEEGGSVLLTWVISAGPNGLIETADCVALGPEGGEVPRISAATRGDDIGCVIAVRFPKTSELSQTGEFNPLLNLLAVSVLNDLV